MNRLNSDGEIIQLRKDGTVVASIGTQNWGIGTASPESALQVTGAVNTTPDSAGVHLGMDANYATIELAGSDGGQLDFPNAANTDYRGRIRYTASDNKMAFFASGAGTQTMTVTNTSVGIGTASPDSNHKLEVASTGTAEAGIRSGNTSEAILNFGRTNDRLRGRIAYNNSSEYMAFWTNQGEKVRLTSAGRLGIGTNSPAQLLHVNSTGNVAAAQIQGASHTAKISTDGAGTIFGTTTNGYMLLATNNAERMRLDSSGNLLVGTTTVGGNGFTFETNGFATFARASGAAQSMIGFKNGGSFVGEIRTSTTATAYLTSSDHRLKENVTADWDATTRLKQLNPVRFNFIADADTTVDGFLAHEVQDIVPEAITGTHNEVDDEGNPVYQGIDQSKLVPLLVKTIQELEARIAALEAN